MKNKKILKFIIFFKIAVLISLIFSQCTIFQKEFTIISGSENKELEPLLKKFGNKNGINIKMKYKGSVDIMLELEDGEIDYDAVWPANSLWISLGDKHHKIKHLESVMRSPVVFGIKKDLAEKLGFVGKDVYIKDILDAINKKELKFMMTSATQSNSGASAYIGFLYALTGNPEVLKRDHLNNSELRLKIRELLSGINRSSGSSGWLKELFLKGNYDAMVNYEALIIEANQELIKQGKEPLYVIYPVDGIVMADSPIGWVDNNKPDKEKTFLKIQEFLLSKKTQNEILKLGRRTGFAGLSGDVNKKVFNPDWGIDINKVISPVKMPAANVIYEALNLYQTEFRKPSLTVYCLDYSGSMSGDGESQLEYAMQILLDQQEARKYLINAATEDITIIIPFSDRVLNRWEVTGNDPVKLMNLNNKIKNQAPGGYTAIYTVVIKAYEEIQKYDLERYIPSIILMTDGESNRGASAADVRTIWENDTNDIPIFSIMFGSASERQLKQLSEYISRGRIFDGRHDLVKAFRSAKGYN